MNVLSLFDGISCGRVALERAGIPVTNYYASEIDKYAIQVSQKNYPDIIHLGDVNNWESWQIEWSSIDLILAGSPCQGFSIAGKQQAFNDKRSALFFRFAEILSHVQSVNPSIKFLLENVCMKKEYQDIITSVVGVEPIMIDSALMSAQRRKRLYWCNWSVEQPIDKGILLKDIIHEKINIDESERAKTSIMFDNLVGIVQKPRGKNKGGVKTEKSPTLTSNSFEQNNHVLFAVDKEKSQAPFILHPYIVPFDTTLQILDKETTSGKIGFFQNDSQSNRIYSIHGKSVTLCGEGGGGAAKMGQYLFGCISPDRIEKRQNGQRFNDGDKFYTLTAQDRHGILINGYIRKLTPIECERLQTLPDNYTEGISNTQRYKCLGNGWTVDVIAHILKSNRGNIMTTPTLEQFLEDVKNHELTIVKNDGVSRHLKFANPNDCNQSFNITTSPNYLVITGDMGSLVFSRLYDMFNFFRNDDLKINPDYWAEKIRTTTYEAQIASYSKFDLEQAKKNAQEYLNTYLEDNDDLSEEDRASLLEDFELEILRSGDEYEIVEAIRNFNFKGFEFDEFYWDGCRVYTYSYIWLCYAIVWGIKKFDEVSQEIKKEKQAKLEKLSEELAKEHLLTRVRPCPFCESNDLFIKSFNSITYAVTCYYCNARGSEEYTQSEAVAKWNRDIKNTEE